VGLGEGMKRDDDLLRQILLDSEASDDVYLDGGVYSGQTAEELSYVYHLRLLADAGLVVPHGNKGLFRITNQGYDYLAAIRDDGIWKKTKEGAAEVGGVSLGIMGELAMVYVKQKLTEVTGLTL
jgi:hypothetical protein